MAVHTQVAPLDRGIPKPCKKHTAPHSCLTCALLPLQITKSKRIVYVVTGDEQGMLKLWDATPYIDHLPIQAVSK